MGSENDDAIIEKGDQQHNVVPEITKKSQQRRENYLSNLLNSKMSDKTNVLSRIHQSNRMKTGETMFMIDKPPLEIGKTPLVASQIQIGADFVENKTELGS